MNVPRPIGRKHGVVCASLGTLGEVAQVGLIVRVPLCNLKRDLDKRVYRKMRVESRRRVCYRTAC